MRPNGELPSDHYADRRRQTPELRRKAHLTVHPPSACSGNLIAGDGTKNGLSRSEQRTVSKTQKQPLDRKSPIQVTCEPVSRGNSPSYVEKPRFSAGVRVGASGTVGRDAQDAATSGLRAVISLSGHIPV